MAITELQIAYADVAVRFISCFCSFADVYSLVKILSTHREGSYYVALATGEEDRSEVNTSVLPSVECLYSNPSTGESSLWGIKVRKSAGIF